MLNKTVLIGRLTKDPEAKVVGDNIAVANFTLAVDRPKYKAAENGKPMVDFIPVCAWRKSAEFVQNYFYKGKQVYVSGRLETYSYEDQNGQKKNGFKINAEELGFADSKKEADSGQKRQESKETTNIADDFDPFAVDFDADDFNDNLPF